MIKFRPDRHLLANRLRVLVGGLVVLPLMAASPSKFTGVPTWLLGDWIAVEIHQDADGTYSSKEDEPRNWLAGQQLRITADSLTLANDRCQSPAATFHHGSWSKPLHEFGGGNLESLGLANRDKVIEYISFECSHDYQKFDNEAEFIHDRTIKITWYAIIHSHTEIDMPFFGGSYVKFKKASPTT